jgi:nucleoside-diphosphate-sugar epimerase
VRRVVGDIEDGACLDAWVRGHDVIIDAAAPYPIKLTRSGQETLATLKLVERRTHALLSAVRKHAAHLIYVGSFATAPRSRHGLDGLATQLIRRRHPYFPVKDRIEEMILAAARDGRAVTLVNPTGCIGPWDCKPRTRCFIPALLRGEIPASTDQMLNVIDVRDLASAIAILVDRGEPNKEPISLAGHNISNDMLFRWICELGDVKPPRLVTPTGAGVIGTYLSEAISTRLEMTPILPALIAMLTYMHGYMAPSPAQIDLNLTLRPLSATLRDTIAWYRAISYC